MSTVPSTARQPQNIDEVLAYINKLQTEDERLGPQAAKSEDSLSHSALQTEEAPGPDAGFQQIDLTRLGVPFNSIYDETFSSSTHLLNILKVSLGPSALQLRAVGPSFAALGSCLSIGIEYGIPGLVGAGGAAASLFFLKSNIEHLIYGDSQPKTTTSWAVDKLWTSVKIGAAGYATFAGLGMFGAKTAVSLALLGGSTLMTLTSSKAQPQSEQTSLGWVGQKALSALKVAGIGYGAIAGLSSLAGYENFPGLPTLVEAMTSMLSSASMGTKALKSATWAFAQTPLTYIIPLGMMLAQQMMFWNVLGKASQSFNKEIKGYWDSEKHSATYQRLGNISNEEYRRVIAEVMGAPSFEAIAPVFESLKSRNADCPEDAARPIIAKLVVLDEEIRTSAQKYSELLNENRLAELETFINEDLKPKLVMQVYLRHCVVDPTRPDLGEISKDGSKYISPVSHLFAQLTRQVSAEDKEALREVIAAHTESKLSDVKIPRVEFAFNELHPDEISAEAGKVLMNEARLQNVYYKLQLQRQMMMQQMMQERAAAEAPNAHG